MYEVVIVHDAAQPYTKLPERMIALGYGKVTPGTAAALEYYYLSLPLGFCEPRASTLLPYHTFTFAFGHLVSDICN